jgi:imidazolonepropionase-like amidohydrolase
VVAGSETGFAVTPYGVWHARELEMLVSYMGFSPLQAIEAATRAGAEVLGWADTVGTVEVGKAADLLVVDGDPLADVRVLQDPECLTVVSRGRVIEPALGGQRQVRPGEKVRFLATRRLTRELARAAKAAEDR